MDKGSSAGRGNREDKAGSASGHKGKDDTKAPQPSNVTGKEPSSTSGQPPVKGKGKGKDGNEAPQSSSTSGQPPVKGKGKDGQPSSTKHGNKAPQPSSTVEKTKDCAAGTEEDSLPSLIKTILEKAMREADVEEITVEFLDSQIEHISQQIQLIQNSLVEKINKSFSDKMTPSARNSSWIAKGEVVRAYNQLRGELSSETLKLSSETLQDVKYLADRVRVRWPQNVQDMMQDLYPSHAVGIDVQLKKVIELLEWESEAKTVAVIVHGIPGIGKTTLADAVFSTIFQQNYNCSTNICKYSKIRLCEDKESSLPSITTLQTTIRDYLVDHDDQRVGDISTFEDGQRKIGNILKKESAFLYIDNVLNNERLDQLLPLRSTLDQAKKLRLLITARDKGIGTVLGERMSCKFHDVPYLPSSEAKKLLKKHMDTQKIEKSVMDGILETAQGVPLILKVIGQFFGAQDDKEKAYSIFKEERENWSGQSDKKEAYREAYRIFKEERENWSGQSESD